MKKTNSESVFDNLVQTLSNTERAELLERINAANFIGDAPFVVSEEPLSEMDMEKEYGNTGIVTRIIIFFRTLFTGLSVYEVLESIMLKKLIKEVDRINPGLIDIKNRMFLPALYNEMEEIKTALARVRPFIENTLSANKKDFIAFLYGRELPMVQEKLLQETNPYNLSGKKSGKSNKEVKEELKFRLEDAFMDINGQEKNRLYSRAVSIQQFHRLCSFPFEEILKGFKKGVQGDPGHCYFSEIESSLKNLTDILYSMEKPPDSLSGEALILFSKGDQLEDENFALEGELKKGLLLFDTAFTRVRQFSNSVPLLNIMKYILKDIYYVPRELSGGEDWFVQYKNFWHERMEKQFSRFVKERKKSDVLEEAMNFLSATELRTLNNYTTEGLENEAVPAHELSLSFLRGFYKKFLLGEMGRPLKLILLEGDFYKEQNRQDYHDAYNEIMKIEENIAILESKMDESGEYGKLINAIKNQIFPASLKRKKIAAILDQADMDADRIVQKSDSSLLLMQNVLDGILFGEVGGRYDTLSNRAYLGGRENKKLLKDLEKVIESLGSARDILGKVKDIEKQ